MKRRHLWLGEPIEELLHQTGYPRSALRLLVWVSLKELSDIPLPAHLAELVPIVGSATLGKRLRPELVQNLPGVVDAYLAAHQAPVAKRAKTYALLLALSPLLRTKLLLEGRCTVTSVVGAAALASLKTADSAHTAADGVPSLDSSLPATLAEDAASATEPPAPSAADPAD